MRYALSEALGSMVNYGATPGAQSKVAWVIAELGNAERESYREVKP
jgi:hypothetical protein